MQHDHSHAGLAADAGAAMRRALAKAAYDVVVLGNMLPDKNGLDLYKWLRAPSSNAVIDTASQHFGNSHARGTHR